MTSPSPESAGVLLLSQIARRFRRALACRVGGWSVAIAAVGLGLISRWVPEWGGVVTALVASSVATLIILLARPRSGDLARAARHLDRVEPQAEESTALWLEEPATVLAALQRRRTLERLAHRDPRPWMASRPWTEVGAAVVGGTALGLAIALWPPSTKLGAGPASAVPEAALALRSVIHTVTPPAYLATSTRSAASLGTAAERGAQVEWRVVFDGQPETVALEVAGKAWPFERDDSAWRLARRAEVTEIVTLTARRGELVWTSPAARLSVLADEPPEVRIVEPPAVVERRLVDLGPLEVAIEAVDDHAVAAVDLVLTVASGAGEGVSFEERRRSLDARPAPEGGPVRAAATLDLRSFGLGPGGELYVVAEARDRSPEERRGRSEPVVVRVLAEGGESSGLGRGIVLRNELEALRSQRQVLMDTERLVAAGSSLAREEFERRAHAIGIDQRAVRLRYGELLGQEFEDGHAVEPEGGHADAPGPPASSAPSKAASARLTDLVPEDLVHSHDSAEMATFFADPVRQQLRTMLAQMWDAELRLRTFRPREALPFEREALRLLKILQESSRVYVPKFSSALPPFDERRRLTGDRSKARDVQLRPSVASPEASEAERWWLALSNAPGRLEGLAAFLEREAAAGRLADLAALDAARRLEGARRTGSALAPDDIEQVARGLWRLLPVPEAAPRSPLGGGVLLERVAPRGGRQ